MKSIFLVPLVLVILSGCRIDVIVPAGSVVSSESGRYECVGPRICSIDVSDLMFAESFHVTTDDGFAFTHWKRRERGLCGGSSSVCTLSTAGFAGSDALLALLDSDEVFF